MQPYQPSRFEWPTIIACFAVFVIAVCCLSSCTLHENPIGHRIDQPPVLVVTPTKPDDDGGAR